MADKRRSASIWDSQCQRTEPHCLIAGPPGSGKRGFLVEEAARALNDGVDPALVAFVLPSAPLLIDDFRRQLRRRTKRKSLADKVFVGDVEQLALLHLSTLDTTPSLLSEVERMEIVQIAVEAALGLDRQMSDAQADAILQNYYHACEASEPQRPFVKRLVEEYERALGQSAKFDVPSLYVYLLKLCADARIHLQLHTLGVYGIEQMTELEALYVARCVWASRSRLSANLGDLRSRSPLTPANVLPTRLLTRYPSDETAYEIVSESAWLSDAQADAVEALTSDHDELWDDRPASLPGTTTVRALRFDSEMDELKHILRVVKAHSDTVVVARNPFVLHRIELALSLFDRRPRRANSVWAHPAWHSVTGLLHLLQTPNEAAVEPVLYTMGIDPRHYGRVSVEGLQSRMMTEQIVELLDPDCDVEPNFGFGYERISEMTRVLREWSLLIEAHAEIVIDALETYVATLFHRDQESAALISYGLSLVRMLDLSWEERLNRLADTQAAQPQADAVLLATPSQLYGRVAHTVLVPFVQPNNWRHDAGEVSIAHDAAARLAAMVCAASGQFIASTHHPDPGGAFEALEEHHAAASA